MILLLQKNIKRIFEFGYIKNSTLTIKEDNKIVLGFIDNNNSVFSLATHKEQEKQKVFVNFNSAVNSLEKIGIYNFSVINKRNEVKDGSYRQ